MRARNDGVKNSREIRGGEAGEKQYLGEGKRERVSRKPMGQKEYTSHANQVGRKSRPVKAITAVKLKLSDIVIHSVHSLAPVETFKANP